MTDTTLPALIVKPVAILDDGLCPTWANDPFADLFATVAADLEGLAAALHAETVLATAITHAVPRVSAVGHTASFRWATPYSLTYQVHLARLPDRGLLAIFDEISDAVLSEDIQAGARAYLEGVLNHIDRAVLVVDVALRVTFMNVAQQQLIGRLGATSPWLDYVGQPVDTAFPVFDAAGWRALCGDVIACGGPGRVADVRVRNAAVAGRLDVHVLPMSIGNSDAGGAVVITTETSADDEDGLAVSDRTAPLVLALQHDVNNPLTTVVAAAEALQRDETLSDAQRERVAAIRKSALDIAEAVRRLVSHEASAGRVRR